MSSSTPPETDPTVTLSSPITTARVPRETAVPPALLAAVHRVFVGQHSVEGAHRYAELLATSGVDRGLIGPREVPRLWERHLLNCAVVAELVPRGARVIDVGSGAGLPGVPLAIARPDLQVILLEPLERRVEWLREVVDDLALPVQVVRGRAEDVVRPGPSRLEPAPVVTARAVAPLDRLARWCLPLVAGGGQLLALKGRTAAEELEAHELALRRAGAQSWEIVTAGAGTVTVPTTVVRVTVGNDGGTGGGPGVGHSGGHGTVARGADRRKGQT